MDWSQEEVEAIVADYLDMLTLELAGQRYSKSEHRKNLQHRLKGRSDGSIEFKHCNISAVMIGLGFPNIQGYQPRSNYQALLVHAVQAQVQHRPILDQVALAAVQQPAMTPSQMDFSKIQSEPPKREFHVAESANPYLSQGVKRDYLAREAQNRSLGFAGEEFVVHYEHWRLIALGEDKLADKVEHVSQTKGDGLGFDVLSFEPNGRERFIEVKTTTFGKDTPFFVSRGELAFSTSAKEQFHLYRLFGFRKSPRMFDLPGAINLHCNLDPVTYRATFN